MKSKTGLAMALLVATASLATGGCLTTSSSSMPSGMPSSMPPPLPPMTELFEIVAFDTVALAAVAMRSLTYRATVFAGSILD